MTDRVNSKIFTTYMDTKLYTAKIEYEAIAFIKYIFGERFGKLFRADAPDIQDENGVQGIEVVKVVTESDGRLEGEVAQYLRATKEANFSVQSKYAPKIERDGGKISKHGVTFSLQSNAKERRIFQEAIKRKLEKLPKYKANGYKNMGIYMLYECPISFGTSSERKEWLDEVQAEYAEKYDIVIVLYQDDISWRISFYDFNTDDILDVEISNDIVNYIGKLGRMTAEGEVKQDDPEWI